MASPASISEYQYISRFSQDLLGLQIFQAGEPADADAGVTVELINIEDNLLVTTYSAAHPSIGEYTILTSSAHTDTPGYYKLIWTYSIGTLPQVYETFIQIGEVAPAFDALPSQFKDIVERVWQRFGDGFDSLTGGPNIQVYFQSHFNRGRIAQAMQWALNRINILQPKQAFTTGPPNPFPLGDWGGLLEQGTYVETIKHLMRSYVEQPDALAVNVARMDRKDYLQRWSEILSIEEPVFKGMLDTFKIRNMGLGGGRVLLSGGTFGNYGPTRMAGNALAARPRFWARFY